MALIAFVVIALIVVVALVGWITSSVATATQAQAVIAVAEVSQAQTQTISTLTLALIAVILFGGALLAYLAWRTMRLEAALREQSGGFAQPARRAAFPRQNQPPMLPTGGQQMMDPQQLADMLDYADFLRQRRAVRRDDYER